ncbi:hypothetical protein ACJ5NV_06620 [Loktanella agnita]|uniref:hypothetical protein n=1 Tax=Loktanella agnita TaxID=287097 RepID=UPI003987423D
MSEIPHFVESAQNLIENSHPERTWLTKLPLIMRVFYDELSDEHMVLLFSELTGLDRGKIRNDVYRSAAIDPTDPQVVEVRNALKQAGLQDWIEAD